MVNLLHAAFGRQHPVGKGSVIGDNQQPLGILIQPAGRKQRAPLQFRRK